MKYLKILFKLLISATIITLIVRKIDEKLLLKLLGEARLPWLCWAIVWFTGSKVMAAYRFNALLATEGVILKVRENLRLYWLGMYYNLLLPGGVSGDGYKIKVLMEKFGKSFKRMFAVTLLDRLSGMVTLGQICLLLLPGIPLFARWWWLSVIGIFAAVPFSQKLYQWAGGPLGQAWTLTTLQSFVVQLSQVVSVLGIIFALGEGEYWLCYSVLFLISSVVAMLPLTIGGAGARELTFLYGASLLDVDSEKAVAIAFLFYLISTGVALFGGVYSFRKQDKILSGE